jgi:hypothetical protein
LSILDTGESRWIDRNKSWVETVGVGIGILGVFFLTWQIIILNNQTKSFNEQLRQTYRNDTFSRSLELDALRIEEPDEFRDVLAANKGTKILQIAKTDPDRYAKLSAIAVYVADFFDYILELYPREEYPQLAPAYIPDDDTRDDYVAWSNAIRDTFSYGSFLCDILIQNEPNYGEGFTERLRMGGVCPGL